MSLHRIRTCCRVQSQLQRYMEAEKEGKAQSIFGCLQLYSDDQKLLIRPVHIILILFMSHFQLYQGYETKKY